MKAMQHQPDRRRTGPDTAPAEGETPGLALGDIDDLLEEIDTLLEDQSVLTNFRQRSGQ